MAVKAKASDPEIRPGKKMMVFLRPGSKYYLGKIRLSDGYEEMVETGEKKPLSAAARVVARMRALYKERGIKTRRELPGAPPSAYMRQVRARLGLPPTATLKEMKQRKEEIRLGLVAAPVILSGRKPPPPIAEPAEAEPAPRRQYTKRGGDLFAFFAEIAEMLIIGIDKASPDDFVTQVRAMTAKAFKAMQRSPGPE